MLNADRHASPRRRIGAKVRSVEWLGQTLASVCWICSVLTYGLSTTGDWLQLAAASSWLVANVAAAASAEPLPSLLRARVAEGGTYRAAPETR